ncbi:MULTISPECIES: hypothetical protein [Methylobacterium]|uniref:hypothetical protein n=1 Tax=Methylobacterium TaxID=407 RepID=UPI00105308AD|nr:MULTISPECIES: hypothetical protein [Methylobacterium]MDR7037619.1 hypothetical protein [Methylobacterium sp. BE186]
MSNAHAQLIAALRLLVAAGDDPRALVDRAIEDIEAEAPGRRPASEAPGPYAPHAWSIYAERAH